MKIQVKSYSDFTLIAITFESQAVVANLLNKSNNNLKEAANIDNWIEQKTVV